MTLDSFQFQNTTQVIFGKDSVEKIFNVIKDNKITKVLLLYGQNSIKKIGLYDRMIESLKKNGIEWVEVVGVQPNPVIEKVREAVLVTKDVKNNVQAILAVGGGSVIDSAKAIAYGHFYDGDPWDLFLNRKNRPLPHLPLYTILTLSATGSEQNVDAVITNKQQHLKMGAPFDYPVATSIDPTLQFTLSWHQIMCGAVDSLSHYMEGFFSLPNQFITHREVNLAFQRSIIRTTDILLKNPNDYDARASFCWAVGQAWGGYEKVGSTDWNVHHLEHALSAYDEKITHACGLSAISLSYYPYIYKHIPAISDEFEQWAERLFGTDVPTAFTLFRGLYVRWKAPLSLNELNIGASDIEAIVEIEDGSRKQGKISPLFPLTKEHTRAILTGALLS